MSSEILSAHNVGFRQEMKIASKTPRCTWVRPLASILKCSTTSFPISIRHIGDSFKWRVIAEFDFLATRCVPAAITDADNDVEQPICTARKGSAFTPPPLLLLNVRAETGAALLVTQTDRFGLPGFLLTGVTSGLVANCAKSSGTCCFIRSPSR